MTDAFALLDQPRGPWLDADALKQRFLNLSSALHPDRFHGAADDARAAAGARYTELNGAYQTLRDPRARLLHLIELESGARPRDIQRIPPGTMELFVEVGQACRDVDAFLEARNRTTSPMIKVGLFRQGIEWVERLKTLSESIRVKAAGLESELPALNEVWAAAPAPGSERRAGALPMARLEEIYRALSYVRRWTDQLQERLVQLASG